jgi:hypothetical protein
MYVGGGHSVSLFDWANWGTAKQLGETEHLRVLPSSTDSRKKTVEILSLALQVAATIADTSGKARALVEIARKYIEVGQYDRALQIAETDRPAR